MQECLLKNEGNTMNRIYLIIITITLIVGLCDTVICTEGTQATVSHKSYSTFPANPQLKKNKKIVLISGDEEYRSEEELPQLAKILAQYHGFDTVVLYAIDPQNGQITPTHLNNIPGLEQLRDADLAIIALRFRALPDVQMKEFNDYLLSGRPLLALRTSTHAFNFPKGSTYEHYSWQYQGEKKDWHDGFGRKILGETWIAHHGYHGKEGTRAIPVSEQKGHPIFKGVGTIVVPSDVYRVRLPLPDNSVPLFLGEVIDTMTAKGVAVPGEKNNPMMPIVWTKSYQIEGGKEGTALVSTMGCGVDLLNDDFRRLLVNGVYWLTGLEKQIPEYVKVDLIPPYEPLFWGFGKFRPTQYPE